MGRRRREYSPRTDATSEVAEAKALAAAYAFILEGHEKKASRVADGHEERRGMKRPAGEKSIGIVRRRKSPRLVCLKRRKRHGMGSGRDPPLL